MTQHPPENEDSPTNSGDMPSPDGQPEQQLPVGEQPTQAMPPQHDVGAQPTQALPPQGPGSPQDAPFSAGSAHEPGHSVPTFGTAPQPGSPSYPGTPHGGPGHPGAPQQPGGPSFHPEGPGHPGGPGYPGGPQGPGGPGHPGGPQSPGGDDPQEKGFFARFWWALVLLGVLFAALVALVIVLLTMGDGEDEDQQTETSAQDETVTEDADTDAEEEARQDEDSGELPEAGEGFGDGEDMVVGEDIEPGVYRQVEGEEDPDFGCSYSVYENEDDILLFERVPGGVVELEDGFLMSSRDCGEWEPIQDSYPDSPADTFGDGVHEIGQHVEEGTYELSWDEDAETCHFAIYTSFTEFGDYEVYEFYLEDDDVWGGEMDLGIGGPRDTYVISEGCGEWELVE